jgi:hypothetical protein
MRVTVRRRYEYAEGTVSDDEVCVEAEGGFNPDVCADLIARACELWGWCFTDEDSE